MKKYDPADSSILSLFYGTRPNDKYRQFGQFPA